MLTSRFELMELYGACALHGIICVPINPLFRERELTMVLRDVEPKVIVTEEFFSGLPGSSSGRSDSNPSSTPLSSSLAEVATLQLVVVTLESGAMREAVERHSGQGLMPAPPGSTGEDDWVILYTSGTTSGVPKGVVRSQMASVAGFLTHTGPLSMDEHTVGLLSNPLYGISSFFFGFLFHYIGASAVVHDTLLHSGSLLATMLQHRPTWVTMAPGHFQTILSPPVDADSLAKVDGSLRTILLSGAISADSFRRSIIQALPQSSLFEIYGSTEAGMVTLLSPSEQALKPGTVGREPPGNGLVKLLARGGGAAEITEPDTPGEVAFNTPMMFTRYWNKPELTTSSFTPDGLFRQGDVASRDADGYFTILGRNDDMIVLLNGCNVFPAELEDVLLGHLDLTTAVVVGLPDTDIAPSSEGAAVRQSSVIVAVVVLKEASADGLPVEQIKRLQKHLGDQVASYKLPSQYVFFASPSDFPTTATGKVQRSKLVEKLTQMTQPKIWRYSRQYCQWL